MTDQQTRPVLFVDGPLAGTWREVPADQHSGVFYENIDPFDPRGLPLGRAHYDIRTVQVNFRHTRNTVEVAYSEPREDLDALVIRRLFTREAANALLGLDLIA